MDFMSLLDTASKNAKNMSKKLDDLKTEVDSERRAELKRIEAEKLRKMEILKKQKKASSPKPAEKEKKFIIPKKNKVTDEKDDKAKVMAFLAKKSEEERQLMEKKKAEKERLIQLRLQANGGKATKKMAKNFGMTAIDLQIKYGTNKEHVERLQKQKWREEEEQERIAAHYRDGVYKALAQKRKLDEKVQAGAVKLKPKHNGSTDKISSITASNRQHSDNYRPSSSSSSEPSKLSKSSGQVVPEKKIKPAPAIGFSELMRAAKDIAEGKDVKLEPKPIHQSVQKRPPEQRTAQSDPAQKRHCNGEDRKLSIDKLPNARIPKIPSGKPLLTSDSAKKPENRPHQSTSFAAKSSSSTTKPFNKPRDDMDVKKERKDERGRFKKAPTPPPLIPPAIPGKRYLPGDIRYKQAMEMQQSSGSANPIRDQPGSSKKMPHESQASRVESNRGKGGDMRKESTHNRTKIGSQIPGGEHRSSSIRSGESLKRYPTDSHRDRIRERDLSHHRKSYGHDRRSEHRHHSYTRAYDYDSFQEEDFEEDEYDSEMDDFIDDSGLDMEELSRQEFEETLKMVNPKYNKKKWREREQTISLKDMHADYRTIAREEARSARIGLIEDLNEATKGKSEAL